MRLIRDWLEKLKDPTRDVYERRYRLYGLYSILVMLVWLVFSTLFSFDPVRSLFFGVTVVISSVTYVYALRTGRVQLVAGATAFSIVFAMIPVAFLFNGGIYAGAPNWFIMALIYIVATVRGRLRVFLIVSDALVTAGFFVLYWYRPELFASFEGSDGFINSLSALVITSLHISLFLLFQGHVFSQERSTLQAQKKEIEELNLSQNRFFSSMSHEIRTPINTIIGLNEMNMREQNISDEVYANNSNIKGASNMLLALINDILDMSKIESGKMDIVPVAYDTGTMLSEIVNMIWSRANEKNLAFSVEVDPTLPVRLYADEVRIKQVLINLLNNAVKYTKEGSVRLQVQCDKTDENNVRVTYRVEDTGMGIKKEALPDLFDAFKRVDQEKNRNIEGTGLGLSIVKQIVDLMDGEITVDSIYTKGSTFSVSFTQEIADETETGELSFSASKAAMQRDTYLQSFEAPTASLLIVDDNELNLQVESKLLQATKMQIDLATSGKECLSMTFRKQYDVIFMDHLMPEMDGIETLKEIRAQRGGLNRDTKVLALTANAGSENQALYAREGFDGYLVKPVTGEQLESTLLSVLPKEKVNVTGAATVQADRETITGSHKKTRSILVTTESGADLPQALAAKYGIDVINSLIRTEESVFYDNHDIESDGLLDYLDTENKRAHSEPPSVKAFEFFFAEGLSKAQNVVHISLGKGVSEDYANAMEAARSFNRVHVLDSGAFSGGTGLLALYAAHLAEQEDDTGRFLARLETVSRLIRSSFIVDSTELLVRGGRIHQRTHMMMHALMLHPVLKMKKGVLSVGAVFAGERERYRKQYIRNALKGGGAIDNSLLLVVYAGMREEELQAIRGIVEAEYAFRRILFVKTSGAIAVNSGRGSFALVYGVREGGNAGAGLFDFLPADTGEEREAVEEQGEGLGAVAEPVEAPHPSTSSGSGMVEAVEATGEATPLQKLYLSSGVLDYDEAMQYLASEDLIEKTLQSFLENIGKNASEIENSLEADDYETYTIKVHALKSSARLVGAQELSELARRLEEYGKFIRS